jgi:hypothetical protein
MVLAVGLAAFVLTRLLGVRVGLVLLLIVTCLVDRFTFPLSGFSIRPEQVAALVALAVLVVGRIHEGRGLPLRPNLAEVALLAWFIVGLVSSVLAAPSRGQSLKILVLLMVSALAVALPRRLLEDRAEEVEQAVRWLLLAFAVEGAYTLIAYFLRIFGPIVSLSVNPAGGHLNAFGTLWEPNVLGAVCGAGAVAWAHLGKRYFDHTWIGIGICLSAMVISFSRASWIATVFVLVLSLILPLRHRIDIRALGLGVAVTLLVGGGVVVADRLGDYYPPESAAPSTGAVGPPPAGTKSSLSRIFGVLANNVDVLGRLYQVETVIADLRGSPVLIALGSGIDSYGERHTNAGRPQHLASLELEIVNDTGLLGLVVFALFGVAVATAALRSRGDPVVTGLGAMVLVIAITNVSTETLELMITWLFIGLLLAAVDAAGAAVTASSSATARTARDTGA